MAAIFGLLLRLSTSKRCGANLRLASTLTCLKTAIRCHTADLRGVLAQEEEGEADLQERLECISVLLEAGASVDKLVWERRRCITDCGKQVPSYHRRHRNALGSRRRS